MQVIEVVKQKCKCSASLAMIPDSLRTATRKPTWEHYMYEIGEASILWEDVLVEENGGGYSLLKREWEWKAGKTTFRKMFNVGFLKSVSDIHAPQYWMQIHCCCSQICCYKWIFTFIIYCSSCKISHLNIFALHTAEISLVLNFHNLLQWTKYKYTSNSQILHSGLNQR